jgi:hypothetical protein
MSGESNEGRLAEIGERTEALSRVVWHQQPAQVLHLLHHDIPFLLAEVSVLQERVRVLESGVDEIARCAERLMKGPDGYYSIASTARALLSPTKEV